MLPSNQELSSLIGILYDAATDPTLWDPFLKQLAVRTRATSAGLLIHDFEHARYSLASSWQVDPGSLRLYQEHYYALDIWARRGLAKPTGYVCTSESLCPLPEIRATEIYNDFMIQSGIEHGMFGVLENNKSCLASVSLYRDHSRPEFTESDLEILHFLAPHLQRAFKLHFQLAEARAYAAGVEAALDMLLTGIVLLGQGGEIVFMNRSAAALVAEKDGLLATRGSLQAERITESTLITKTIQDAVSVSNGSGTLAGGTVLVSRRVRPPLQILVSPVRNSVLKSFQRVAAVALINDPLRTKRPEQAILRMLYGLTAAECRVALLLSDGYAPREIAEKVGVTDNTVRSQIKSIFSKTGVKRQGELIRLLLRNAEPTILGSGHATK